MKRPIDIDAQFKKLFGRFADNNAHLLKPAKLWFVEGEIASETRLGKDGHWTYNLNRHLALIELRDAIKLEISK